MSRLKYMDPNYNSFPPPTITTLKERERERERERRERDLLKSFF